MPPGLDLEVPAATRSGRHARKVPARELEEKGAAGGPLENSLIFTTPGFTDESSTFAAFDSSRCRRVTSATR